MTDDVERSHGEGRGAQHALLRDLGGLDWLVHWLVDPAKTVDQDERGNAERRALFVGLWPPMFWLMGDSLKAAE
jgi:hypothetical protein